MTLEGLREDLNRKALRRRRMKEIFFILMALEGIGLLAAAGAFVYYRVML